RNVDEDDCDGVIIAIRVRKPLALFDDDQRMRLERNRLLTDNKVERAGESDVVLVAAMRASARVLGAGRHFNASDRGAERLRGSGEIADLDSAEIESTDIARVNVSHRLPPKAWPAIDRRPQRRRR